MQIFLKIIFLLIPALLLCCQKLPAEQPAPSSAAMRIISLAPSITESLFALGLGPQVVGVTNFCTYPPQVKALPKVGGYVDPNYEFIVLLKPDLVILLNEHVAVTDFLTKAGIRWLTIDNHNISAICSSFVRIGAVCNRKAAADSIVESIQREMVAVNSATIRPRVLLCVGRDNVGGNVISSIYAAGPRTFYNNIIEAAGGRNVLVTTALEYPQIAAEGIIQLSPDIVIELVDPSTSVGTTQARHDWDRLTKLIKKNTTVAVLKNDYVTIPGPRLSLTLRDFKTIIRQKP